MEDRRSPGGQWYRSSPMLSPFQAVVAAGGKGTRTAPLSTRYGNKSLIPICGMPAILHTVSRLRGAGFTQLFVTVNYDDEFRRIERLFAGVEEVAVTLNRFHRNSCECIGPHLPLLGPTFVF